MARILGAKGLRGGLRIEVLTDWPARLEPGGQVYLEASDEPMRISRVELGGRIPVLHLEGVESREAADALVGRYLEGPAIDLAEDEYFWDELIGLRVETLDGTTVGELVEVFRAGGSEVYRVVGPSGERLVPALASVVRSIDLAEGTMTVADDDAEEVR